jgi:hypothetical protein
MSDESTPDEVAPTEPSIRPKDYLSETDVPVGLRGTVHELYETVTSDGSEGGRYENVRLIFRVPPEYEAEGKYSHRAGWLVYRCGLTGNKFAVPKGALVPMLAADKPKSDGEGTWLKTPYVLHPDLMCNRPQLLEELAWEIDAKIFDLLYELCEQFNLLGALSEMEELPDSDADPYPKYRGERNGYEIVGDRRPACSE